MKAPLKLAPIEWSRTEGLVASAPEWTAYNSAEGWTAMIRGPQGSNDFTYFWEFIGNTRTYSQRVLPHEPFPRTLALAIAAVKKVRERWVRQRRAEVGPDFGRPRAVSGSRGATTDGCMVKNKRYTHVSPEKLTTLQAANPKRDTSEEGKAKEGKTKEGLCNE